MKRTMRTTTRRSLPSPDRQAIVEQARSRLKAPQWADRLEQAQKADGPPCARCGATQTVLEACLEGPHYAAIKCADCDRFLGWAPWPSGHDDYDRARRFVLPFGMHRGRTLESVGATPRGRRYLEWLFSEASLKPAMHRALEIYLKGPS